MSIHKPDIVALLETRISGETAMKACRKIGQTNWVRVEADGFRGGIWLLWDGDCVELSIIRAHKQFVHVLVEPNKVEEWTLSIVYGIPKPPERADLWRELEEEQPSKPWCVMGDFNVVLSSEERSPSGRTSASFQRLGKHKRTCGLGFHWSTIHLESWERSSAEEICKA